MKKFEFDNMPQFRILNDNQVEEMHENAIDLLENLGIVYAYDEALKILENGGCEVDWDTQKVKIPREIVEKCICSTPSQFKLYDREGNEYCDFGDGKIRFNPGSSACNVLDHDGSTVRLSNVGDLKLLTKVADSLDELDFISSSIVCEEAPGELGSQYLYYTEMRNSSKPIIGGSTDVDGVLRTFELLKAVLGSEENVRNKPYTIFDVCVTSPLKWSTIGAKNIIDCAKRDIPLELISAQITGATGPITLAGAVLQHTVEILSGLVLAQLVKPGHPVVYGGAPCIFNMKTMYTPMEAMESNMITAGYALMGKYYGLPVHTYAAMSDSKVIDYQAGSETARSGMMALMLGIDNVSGPGGLNVIAEMSIEKLVMDADFIGTLKHLEKGMRFNDSTLAKDVIFDVGSGGNYMANKHTLKNYKKEQYYGNIVMNYQDRGIWKKEGSKTIFDKSRDYVERINEMKSNDLNDERIKALDKAFLDVCLDSGLDKAKGPELIDIYNKL
ncbi:MAG: trimethylamine methyltransferase family protein [Peptostreptococcaceae bacterium]|nr:trimethylamine methyltransferase family protein [Peptostreptococcaceae bacterium]